MLTLRGFSFKYGGSPSIISIAIIPKLQISTLGPYCFLVTTSGAIQYGVPTIVDLLFCSGVIVAQKPKSAVNRRMVFSSEIVFFCQKCDNKILSFQYLALLFGTDSNFVHNPISCNIPFTSVKYLSLFSNLSRFPFILFFQSIHG